MPSSRKPTTPAPETRPKGPAGKQPPTTVADEQRRALQTSLDTRQ